MSAQTILNLAEELRVIADELETNTLDTSNGYHARGTIVKANEGQSRFKSKSKWVSLGDGTYQHLTGEKNLVTSYDRLDGFVSVFFEA